MDTLHYAGKLLWRKIMRTAGFIAICFVVKTQFMKSLILQFAMMLAPNKNVKSGKLGPNQG